MNTKNVEDMNGMFIGAKSFNNFLIENIRKMSMYDMTGMFMDATSLDQPLKFNIRNDTQTDWMFVGSSGRLDDSEAYAMSLANILIG